MKPVKSTTTLTPFGTAKTRLGAGIAPALSITPSLHQAVRERDLDEKTLYLAWEITRCVQGLSTHEQEALLFLVLCTIINVREGSTCLPIGDGNGYLADLFESLGAGDDFLPTAMELIAGAQSGKKGYKAYEILGRPGDYKPLILDGNYLYHQRMLDQEELIAASLRERLASSAEGINAERLESAIHSVLEQPPQVTDTPVELSDEQVQAVRTALTRPLSIISGGPGTGKTSVVVSILRVLARTGMPMESIALAAPTGKAANRMEESVKSALLSIPDRDPVDEKILTTLPEPQTLHRLLGYSPRDLRFRHGKNNSLSHQVVIVDEASMIDLELMNRLVPAVRPGARLVLLGDADQLPSVDAGAVFRDLMPPEDSSDKNDPRHRASARLTRNYRMDAEDPAGRNILLVAGHINAGRADVMLEAVTERATAEDLTYEGVELILTGQTAGTKRAFLESWFTDRVVNHPDFEELVSRKYRFRQKGFDEDDTRNLLALFKHSNSHRLLCITSRDADHANYVLDNKVAGIAHPDRQFRRSRARFHPGEPIMMLRNDYERGLFNGDQGLVLNVATSSKGARAMAVFPRKEGFAVFELEPLAPDVMLSFAMTVHKSQGSEFDHVGLILPDKDLPLLAREILYTAATRSRRSVVMLGSRKLLAAAIARQVQRASGIAIKLQLPP